MDRYISSKRKYSDEDKPEKSEPKAGCSKDPDPETESEVAKKKGRKQMFKEEWKQRFKWLTQKMGQSFCVVCNKALSGGITHLERHEASSIHKKRIHTVKNTPKVDCYVQKKDEKHSKLVKEGELKLTMFLHEHNLPFLLMDHLPKLISSVCPDSTIAREIKCGRTKATAITKDCIGIEQTSALSAKLQNNVFSIIVDETTDVSTQKALVVVARFFDNGWTDEFLGLVRVKSCTANEIFNEIVYLLDNLKIPVKNLVGFAADNANVMMGNISGVQAKFKEILPNIFVLGCICHSFHLCSSAAAKKLPRSLEDFIRSVYNYFAHSSKRIEAFEEYQIFVNLKPRKLLHPSQTRWLSLEAAVNRVLENWDALKLFFINEYKEDNLHSTKLILDSLNTPIIKVYFLFLAYILETVNKLNLEFQSEKPKIHLILKRISTLYQNVLKNFIKVQYLQENLIHINPSNPRNFMPIEEMYFGAKCELLLSSEKINEDDIKHFKLRALDFYIELSNQIKQRFNFDDPVLNFAAKFEPEVVLSGKVRSIVVESVEYFPQLVTDIEKLNSEYRLLADLRELKEEKESSEDFWIHIFDMKNGLNEPMFPNLTKLVKGIFSLPHSSAAAERIFSQMNLLKTKTRNKLLVDTCDGILHAKQMLKKQTCYSWKPSPTLLSRNATYK